MPDPKATLESIEELIRALENGGYNAAPSKLRSGSISFTSEEPLTEEQVDRIYTQTFDHRHINVLSVADVENAIVDEIEMGTTNYQLYDWTPINRAFDRLRKLASSRATPPPAPTT